MNYYNNWTKKANVVDTKHGKLIGINKCINCNDFEKDPDDDPMCIKFPICRSEKFAKDIIEAIRGNLCLRDIENLIKELKIIEEEWHHRY